MKHLLDALKELDPDRYRQAVMECEGSKHHSPTPLVTTLVLVGEEQVPLCPTCSFNFRVYYDLMIASNGSLSWKVRREFGNLIRALGDRARETTHGGTSSG